VDNLLVICHCVDSRFRIDNTTKAIKSQSPHRSNRLFFDFNLFQYKAIKTTTIHTKTARESVATIHAIRTTKAKIDNTVFSFFLTLFVKSRQI
jgi:hypothetical protein